MKKLILLMLLPLFLCSCGDSTADDTAETEIIPLHSNLVAKYGDVDEDFLLYLQDGITEHNITVGDEDVSITLAQTYHDEHVLAMAVDVSCSDTLFGHITASYEPVETLAPDAYLPMTFECYLAPIENPDNLSASDYRAENLSDYMEFSRIERSLVAVDTESNTLSYVFYLFYAEDFRNLDIHMILTSFSNGSGGGFIHYDSILPIDFSLDEGLTAKEFEIANLADGKCYFSPLCYYISYNTEVDNFPKLSLYTILEDGTEGEFPNYRFWARNNIGTYSSIGETGWLDTHDIAEVCIDGERTIKIAEALTGFEILY